MHGMQLYDPDGQRKYFTPSERDEFLKGADSAPCEVRTFCGMLAYTGCRISEALALTADRVDIKAGVIVFETLKKRRSPVCRPVPAPPSFLDTLNMVHDLRTAHTRKDRGRGIRLWDWSRVCELMAAPDISCPHGTLKGLRHGFGINAATSGVPLNVLQKWLGHAALSTTAICAEATGPEAKQIAERMWV